MGVGSRIVIMKYCARSCRLFDLRDGSFEIISAQGKFKRNTKEGNVGTKRKSIVLGVDYLEHLQ
jgi:hypothetical protein